MKTITKKFTIILMVLAFVAACSDDDSVPRNPIIKIDGSTLEFGSVDVTETSQVRSYTIAAEGLSGPIDIAVDAPFYISLSADGNFTNSVSLSPDDFGNDAIPVFVMFKPESSDEGLYEETITHTSVDRDNIASISVSGIATIPGEAMLTPSESSIDFGNVQVNEVSGVMSYTLSGSDLEANVTVEVTAPFTISVTEDGSFTNSLNLSASDVMGDKIIYVRFEPTEEGSAAGTISHNSDDFSEPVEVSLTGEGDPLPDVYLTIDPTTLDFGAVPLNQTSDAISYSLSGTGLNSEVTLTASEGFMISREEEGDFGQNLTFTADELNEGDVDVFVQFESAGELGEKNGTITHSSDDLDTDEEVVLQASSISADTKLFSDNFDYTAGEPVPSTDRTGDGSQNATLDGWLKVRTGNTDIQVVDEGLSYSGYPGSDIGNAVRLKMEDPGSNSNVYAHNLSQQQSSDFVGAYYTSFLLKIDALPDDTGGGYNRTVMLVDWLPNGATKFLSSVQVNYNAGDPKIGVMYEGDFTLTNVTPEVGKTYLIILKHIVTDADQSNNNNAAEIFVFENGNIPATEPESPDARVEMNTTGDNYLVKAVTVIRDNSRGGNYVVDGIKFSTQWQDILE